VTGPFLFLEQPSMNPAVLSIIQALITLGPSALDAINAIVNALHNQPTTPQQEAAIGKAVAEAVRKQGVHA
jgi:hypothetical protein